MQPVTASPTAPFGSQPRQRRVLVEAPWRALDPDTATRNEQYTLDAMADCLARGEAPLSSAVLYALSGVLSDDDPVQRRAGMYAGFNWGDVADAVVVYEDHGISNGMADGIMRAAKLNQRIEYRRLHG